MNENHIVINSANYLVPNISNGYDLLISNLECFKQNTYEIRISSYSSQGENILYGKKYNLLISDGLIYEGFLRNGNIFPVTNIPLHLLVYHKLIIIIYNFTSDPINYNLQLTHIPGNKFFDDEAHCDLEWPHFDKEYYLELDTTVINLPEYNWLRFMCGMGGVGFNCKIDYKYFLKLKYKIDICGECVFKKIYHLTDDGNFTSGFSKWCQPYHSNYILSILVANHIDNHMLSKCDILMETLKVPAAIFMNTILYDFHNSGDAITNIEILTKGSINEIFVQIYTPYGDINRNCSYIKTDEGYKLDGCDDFNHIVIIGETVMNIKIILCDNMDNTDNVNSVWIKYDRAVYNSGPRKGICQYLAKIQNKSIFVNVHNCYQLSKIHL